MQTQAITKAGGCGCSSMDPAAFPSWSEAKSCGCGGKGGAGCGCGSAGASTALGPACTSGSAEATKRAGVVTGGCLPPRARFFPGELVTDADLTAAVDYHRAQQLLANGVVGGWGVYCGFPLSVDASSCTLCVGPGIAADARGRMIVHDATICLRRPDAAQVSAQANCDPCAQRPDEELYLAIVYDDCLDGAKPRYGSVCGPGPDPGCDFSRVSERGRLVWLRDVDANYWTSGCLADPCGNPPNEPNQDCMPAVLDEETREPKLDECTPRIGIRGGRGVEAYARALDARWALSRNVRLLSDTTLEQPCGLGVATLIDVISGVACEPCAGEAVVVLGRVHFGTANGQPSIRISPLRRRVLSNANLTYLVEWLMQYVICNTRSDQASPEKDPPPTATATCNDPCIDDRKLAERVARAAIGDEEKFLDAAESRAAWQITFKRKKTLAEFDRATFLEVAKAAFGKSFSAKREESALARYHELLGRTGREAEVRRGVELLYPRGSLPADKRPAVEDAVYAFLRRHKVDELGTASAPLVVALANSINEGVLGKGAYPSAQVARLAKVLPEGVAAPEVEVAALRERVRELEAKINGGAATDEATPGDETPEPPVRGRTR